MSWTMFRYVLKQYVGFCAALMAGVLAIFLVADFVDRAKLYIGNNWVADASVLYAYKALVTFHQLAPGVLLLAAAVTVSAMRKRGELTALRSLSFGPAVLFGPVALFALVVCLGLVEFDEAVVGRASLQVDVITAKRFHRWGDWVFFFGQKQWFRHDNRIFHLQGGDAETGFTQVNIFTMTPDFNLQSRMDAKRMDSLGGTRWRLTDVLERTFDGHGGTSLQTHPTEDLDFHVRQGALNILPGRPEQLSFRVLRDQIRARRSVGLPYDLHLLALHNRFAYPLAGLPAALLAVGLALRKGRTGHLTAAIVEGLLIAMALWSMMVVAKSLVLSGRLIPGAAAWLPTAVLVSAGLSLWFGPALRRRWRSA